MSTLALLFLMQATAVPAAVSEPAAPAPFRKIEKPLHCRIMIAGYSRSGDITICRPKAVWRELEACRGATRYCSPEQKAAITAKQTAFALSEDSRIVCRVLAATGSRLRTQNTCMPRREWQRLWDDSRATVGNLQNKQSTRPENFGQ